MNDLRRPIIYIHITTDIFDASNKVDSFHVLINQLLINVLIHQYHIEHTQIIISRCINDDDDGLAD